MDVSAECRTVILKDLTAGLVRREAATAHSARPQLQTLQLLAEGSSGQRDGARDGGAAVDAWVAAVLALLDSRQVRIKCLLGDLSLNIINFIVSQHCSGNDALTSVQAGRPRRQQYAVLQHVCTPGRQWHCSLPLRHALRSALLCTVW